MLLFVHFFFWHCIDRASLLADGFIAEQTQKQQIAATIQAQQMAAVQKAQAEIAQRKQQEANVFAAQQQAALMVQAAAAQQQILAASAMQQQQQQLDQRMQADAAAQSQRQAVQLQAAAYQAPLPTPPGGAAVPGDRKGSFSKCVVRRFATDLPVGGLLTLKSALVLLAAFAAFCPLSDILFCHVLCSFSPSFLVF